MHISKLLATLFSILICLTLSIACTFAAPPVAPAPQVPAPPHAHAREPEAVSAPIPQAKEKCPVCGMFVSKYPDWIVSVTFKDASTLFFDGAKDFFTYYHNIQKYTPSKFKAAIATVTINDYYTLKPLNAQKAYFVMGSDVYGPMGKELVPFAKLSDAYSFMKDHKGKMVLRFTDVSPAALKTLE